MAMTVAMVIVCREANRPTEDDTLRNDALIANVHRPSMPFHSLAKASRLAM